MNKRHTLATAALMFAIFIVGSSNEPIPVCGSNMPATGYVDPSTDINIEVMTFACAVSFNNSNPPSLIWSLANDSQSFNASDCQQQRNILNCSLTLRPDLLYNGSVFVCHTSASDGARFNCSTEVIKVQRVIGEVTRVAYVTDSSDKETTTQGNLNPGEEIGLKTPQNQVVYLGQRMAFNCQPFNGSAIREWLYRPLSGVSDTSHNKLFTNWMIWKRSDKTPASYGVYGDESGFAELYLNETEMKDAGRYTCTFENKAKMISRHAELIVFESEPECNVTEVTGHRIQVKCSVVYSGNWTPKMEWRHHITGKPFQEGTLFTSGKDTVDHSNKTHVTSTLTALILHSQEASFVSCKIHFDPWKTYPSDMSTNVPEYIFIWNSTVFGEKDPASQTKSTGIGSLPGPSSPPSNQLHNEAPNNENNRTLMYTVVALAFTLILLMVGTLTYIFRKRRSRKSKEKALANDEEEKKAARVVSGAYDTIEYDVIGYEMLDQEVIDVDDLNRGYEVPGPGGAGERATSGYEHPDKNQLEFSSQYITTMANPDKALPELYDGQMAIPSQYISTNAVSTNESPAGISDIYDSKLAKQGTDYTHLYGFVGPKRRQEEDIPEGKQLPPYIQLIDDAEEGKSKTNRQSVSSEGSDENGRIPAASVGYTQLMPDAGYTPLVTE